MRGVLVREYSPEELAALSLEEVNEAIARDLYVNAYDLQREHRARYPGRRLAEYLETALYLCPACGGLKTLRSKDDLFSCSCGLCLRYRPDGFLEDCGGGAPPFETVFDWFGWQKEALRETAERAFSRASGDPLLTDEKQDLVQYSRTGKSRLVCRGKLLLYRDRMEFLCPGGRVQPFPFSEISDMTIHGRATLMFTMPGPLFYEIPSRSPRSALPYLELFQWYRRSGGRTADGSSLSDTETENG
jgi:hypothetical protein